MSNKFANEPSKKVPSLVKIISSNKNRMVYHCSLSLTFYFTLSMWVTLLDNIVPRIRLSCTQEPPLSHVCMSDFSRYNGKWGHLVHFSFFRDESIHLPIKECPGVKSKN